MILNTKERLNKRKFILFLSISFYFYLFQSIPVYSQDSLSFYLEIAGKNNPTVMQKYFEYQAALQKVPQVGSMPDPELSIGIFLSPMELVSGNQVADIRLMQMFPWFGVLANAKDEMNLMSKAKYESFRDAKVQVYFEIQRNWYELLKIQEEIKVSEKNMLILESIKRILLVKFKTSVSSGNSNVPNPANGSEKLIQSNSSGTTDMGSMNSGSSAVDKTQTGGTMSGGTMGSTSGGSALADIYRLQIESLEIENSIELLRNRQISLTARFNTFLNRTARTKISLPDSLMEAKINLAELSVSDSMFNNNPMLGMLQYESHSLDARRKMVTSMGYPMLGLGVNYSLINKSEMSTSSMNGKDMIMPMVTITLPIYRKKYKSMVSETDFLKQANEQNYKATANSLESEYFEAVQSYQDALSKMKLYSKQSQLTKQTLELLMSSFSGSGSGLTDLLRIRQQLLEYQLKQIEAISDYNTDIAWIKRLTDCIQIK